MKIVDDLLPIGSVVQLHEGEKKVMICGRLQQQADTGTVWDYSACLYPEGIIDPNELYLFDNESIERLYYVGMQDGEEFAFRQFLLGEALAEINKGLKEQQEELV